MYLMGHPLLIVLTLVLRLLFASEQDDAVLAPSAPFPSSSATAASTLTVPETARDGLQHQHNPQEDLDATLLQATLLLPVPAAHELSCPPCAQPRPCLPGGATSSSSSGSSGTSGAEDNQPGEAQPRGGFSRRRGKGVTVAFRGEFGYELMTALPFAYWHFLNGSLSATSSCGDPSLALLYYFSPHHSVIPNCSRTFKQNNQVAHYGFTAGLHHSELPETWAPPPLVHRFREMGRVWDVPFGARLVVISNKYEKEWQRLPVNFIAVDVLMKMVRRFLDEGFYVVYNRAGKFVADDEFQALHEEGRFDDHQRLLREFGEPGGSNSASQNASASFPSDTSSTSEQPSSASSPLPSPSRGHFAFMQHVAELPENEGLSFNEVQWRLMARSTCFVSVQGGNSFLTAYFGGRSIIFARKGGELVGGTYSKVYPKFAGAQIEVTASWDALLEATMDMAVNSSCKAL